MSERLAAESVERSLFVSAACDCHGLELITSPPWNVSWLENTIFTWVGALQEFKAVQHKAQSKQNNAT